MGGSRPARLVLYGRGYCHLCEDMRAAVAEFETGFDFSLTVIDIDAAAETDPALLARYDELVPVLAARLADGSERELCHYFLDPAALTACLTDCGAARMA